MAKSKRNKIVHLTQVKKKTKDHKEDLIKQVEKLVNLHKRVFVLDLDGVKSDRIMNLRIKLKPFGSIFAGKNTMVASVLKKMGSKTNRNYEDLLKLVKGHRGLLFTDINRAKLIEKIMSDHPEFEGKVLGSAQLKAEPESEEGASAGAGATGTAKSQAVKGIRMKRTSKRKKSAEMDVEL